MEDFGHLYFLIPGARHFIDAVSLAAAIFGVIANQIVALLWNAIWSRGKHRRDVQAFPPPNPELLSKNGIVYKGGVFHATDLEFCKKTMNSSIWIDRLKEDSLVYCTQFGKPLGLIWGGGRHYKEARAVTTKVFHRLGFYKLRPLEAIVHNAAIELLRDVNELVSQRSVPLGSIVLSPHRLFQPYVLSLLWQFMFGGDLQHRQVSPRNPAILRIHHSVSAASKSYNSMLVKANGHAFSGLLAKIPFVWLGLCAQTIMFSSFRKIIRERRRVASSLKTSEPSDFLSGLLQEVDRTKGEHPYMTEEAALVILRDMVLGSTETIGDALEFALLHVSLNERIQERVYDEIDLVIGTEGLPSYSHRARMIYTQAVLLETLRYGSVVQVGTRVAREDTIVGGIHFPKGSVVVVKSLKIHQSKRFWRDPDTFRPERFIAENGLGLINTEKVIPFGFGKRSCVGEQLGQLTLFIFFVTLLQSFRFQIPQELPPPSENIQAGFGRSPETYYLRATPRRI